jgi:hypothetical protein
MGSTTPLGETNTPGPLASTAGHAGLGAVVVVVVVDSVVVVVADFDAVDPCTAAGLPPSPLHATSAIASATATTGPRRGRRLGVSPR